MRFDYLTAAALSLGFLVAAPLGAEAQQAEAMKYCRSDVSRLCPGVQPGGGRILGCLKAHKMDVSVGCAKALQAMKAKMGQ
jgi:hypothetical protein